MKWIVAVVALLTVGCGGGSGAGGSGSTGGGNISGTTVLNVSAPNAPFSYTINTLSNPGLTLQRGVTYTFNLNASGHPFYIMSVQGTDTLNAYTSGVTNNGADTGVLTFAVPLNAPSSLYYDCQFHTAMTGTITITN